MKKLSWIFISILMGYNFSGYLYANPTKKQNTLKKIKPTKKIDTTKKEKPTTLKDITKKEKPTTLKDITKKAKPTTLKDITKKAKPTTLRKAKPTTLAVKKEKPALKAKILNIPDIKKRWKVSIDGAPMRGDKNAPITIVEFSDFQCPYCAGGSKLIKQILKKYRGKVRLVFKHYPLSFHPDAHLAAQASMAADAQGQFWAFHDKLFANRQHLKRADLEKYAKELKLDMKKFKEALDKGIYKKIIKSNKAEGQLVRLEGTPTAYINGFKTWLEKGRLEAIIQSELKWLAPYQKSGWKGSSIYKEIYKKGHIYHAPIDFAPALKNEKLIGQSAVWGSKKALVTITSFSDYQCYRCVNLNRHLYTLKKLYKNDLRLVFRHYPIDVHKGAFLAAKAAIAANNQGKFVSYNEKLFANQANLTESALLRYAKELKLNMKRFVKDLHAKNTNIALQNDIKTLEKWHIQFSPVFFINGHRIPNKLSLNILKRYIDHELLNKGFQKDDLPQLPAIRIPLAGSPWIGAKKPFGTVVVFSDFQCPYCAKASQNLRPIIKAYGKYIRFVFKHFPLSFHKNAYLAAQASLAAHAQGKFWAFHDKLFANQDALSRKDLERYAKTLKLNMKKFKEALSKKIYAKKIAEDLKLAMKFEVNGTPTFFLKGAKIDAYHFRSFKKYLDPILLKHGIKQADLPKAPRLHIPLAGSPWKGAKKPLITIVEFSDFQCPFCSNASRLLKKIAKHYKKYVRIVFKNFPLGFHRYAYSAALAAQAAHAQGKFWEFHDKLFSHQNNLARKDLEKYAQELKLNMKQFKEALDKKTYKRNIAFDYILGIKLQIQGTPSFFINGEKANIYNLNILKNKLNSKLIELGVKKKDLPK